MKSNRINYVVVGVFVLAMAVALMATVVTLSGGSGATDRYHAVYRNVTGVKFGTQVLYEGYPVGQVEDVVPEPEGGGMRFRVDFSVREGWRIPSDSVAAIQAPGLLSAIVIAISEGSSQLAANPGDRIDSREADNLFAAVASVAEQVNEIAVTDLRPLLTTLNAAAADFGEIVGEDGKVLVGELSGVAADLAQPGAVDRGQCRGTGGAAPGAGRRTRQAVQFGQPRGGRGGPGQDR